VYRGAVNAQATATQEVQDAADAQAAADATQVAQAQADAAATQTALAGQGDDLASFPSGTCVVGMPDHDMRIAVNGNGAEHVCQDFVDNPVSEIGPMVYYSSGGSYDPTAVTLSLNDGTSLSVVCQYSLPYTTIRIFDDGLTKQYARYYCNNYAYDGVSSTSVG
jgi:hypothetical protein